MSVAAHQTEARVASLWKQRPRSRFVQGSLLLFLALLLGAWFLGDFDPGDTFSARRAENFARFLGEVQPYALRDAPFSWSALGGWCSERMGEHGWEALLGTLALSVLAIVLAALASLPFSLLAARNVATPHPFAGAAAAAPLWSRALWRLAVGGTRLLLILLRSLPEYILAFLFMSMLGSPAWPAVLALAIHNTGILGRLNAETIENVEARPLIALRALGASRAKIAAAGIFPAILPRFLLYFFYRWETCVREATVLGLLGLASLGYWIDESQVAFRYDEMVFYILLGSALVLGGDLLSAVARRLVRRAS